MSFKWNETMEALTTTLSNLSVRDRAKNELGPQQGIDKWLQQTIKLREQRKILYLIGNGASASMCSHMAADLTKNARLHTHVFSNISLVTAISNDISYEEVFATPLLFQAHSHDALLVVSSSGNSKNLLRAVEVAREIGMEIVTLTAMSPDNPLRQSGDINLYVPADTYGLAETAHAAVLHYWMDGMELADAK